MATKRDKERVDYRPAEACFHCAGFLRPDEPGLVNGQCLKVRGAVHPGAVCDLFEPAIEEDGDDNGNPRVHEQQISAGV